MEAGHRPRTSAGSGAHLQISPPAGTVKCAYCEPCTGQRARAASKTRQNCGPATALTSRRRSRLPAMALESMSPPR
eukprot:6667463-Prymnesium_polylepis.1